MIWNAQNRDVVATAVLAVDSASLSTSASAFGLLPLGGLGLVHPGLGLVHPGFGLAHPGGGYGLGHLGGSFDGRRFGGSPYHGDYDHGGGNFYRGYAYRAAPVYGGYDYGGGPYDGDDVYADETAATTPTAPPADVAVDEAPCSGDLETAMFGQTSIPGQKKSNGCPYRLG